jgi:hypothetical protein
MFIAFQGEKITGNIYEVVDIGENFVLANTCNGRGTTADFFWPSE